MSAEELSGDDSRFLPFCYYCFLVLVLIIVIVGGIVIIPISYHIFLVVVL